MGVWAGCRVPYGTNPVASADDVTTCRHPAENADEKVGVRSGEGKVLLASSLSQRNWKEDW